MTVTPAVNKVSLLAGKMRRLTFSFVLLYFTVCLSENVASPIQAFVIPHSHMDVGWVYTVQVTKVFASAI